MKLKSEEISSILKEQIQQYEKELELTTTGRVVRVGDGICYVYGLSEAMYAEMIQLPGDTYGVVLNLEESMVGLIVLGDDIGIKEGDEARCTGRILQVPAGEALLGRVVDPLGNPLDGKGPIETDTFNNIETRAPNVVERQPVNQPLQTGLKAIDSMIPIGRGQRELILGDRGIGKTAITIDTIINQRDDDVISIYVAIGQKNNTVAKVVKTLEEHNAMDKTVVVHAGSSSPASLQYIAPYSGCAIGEYFRDNGGHSLVIYDDLSKHAWAYRQLSLLLRRPPGREAYPGDVFYLHSRLLERAAKLSDEMGGGSLTAIPIIETQAGDISTYIPTNVISITDGQIYVEDNLFYGGFRPAINAGLSVSRVGGAAQVKAMRKVAGMVRLDLAQYRELEKFAQFGTDIDKTTMAQLERGRRTMELLKQKQYRPMPVAEQVVVISAVINGMLDEIPVDEILRFEKEFLDYLRTTSPELLIDIAEKGEIDEDTSNKLKNETDKFVKGFVTRITKTKRQTEE
ncbi:MAG: F0F1 ATP synthase subunit alpha [bacterium]|nr:F0F1 ATP synthase subunit alpha [bacterium]